MSLRRWLSDRPTAVYSFRYEREDGMHREITVPSGEGRFKSGSVDEARELADRRLNEQYGGTPRKTEAHVEDADGVPLYHPDGSPVLEETVVYDPPTHKGEPRPDLHQKYYVLTSVERIK